MYDNVIDFESSNTWQGPQLPRPAKWRYRTRSNLANSILVLNCSHLPFRKLRTQDEVVGCLDKTSSCGMCQNIHFCHTSSPTLSVLCLAPRHCNTLQHASSHYDKNIDLCHTASPTLSLLCLSLAPNNTMQHTATHCHTLQHTVSHSFTPHHTATHCTTLQHPASYMYTYTYVYIHTSEWVMPLKWMSHVSPINELHHTYEWVLSHIRLFTNSISRRKRWQLWVISHRWMHLSRTWLSHVTLMTHHELWQPQYRGRVCEGLLV